MRLTNNTPSSSHGMPVFLIRGSTPVDYATGLRALLYTRSMTAARLAECIGYAVQDVCQWIAGDRVPPKDALSRIQHLFFHDDDYDDDYTDQTSYYCYGVTMGIIVPIDLRDTAIYDIPSRGTDSIVVASRRPLSATEILTVCDMYDRGEVCEGNLPGDDAAQCNAVGVFVH